MIKHTLRAGALAGAAIVAFALAACSSDITTVDQAQAQVTAKEKAVTDAQANLTAKSAAFCTSSSDYITALDAYGNLITDSAPTVGDVANAGTVLLAPKDNAFDGADAAVTAQQQVITAQQELAQAQATLERIQAGPSPTAEVVVSSVPTPEPLAPKESVDRVKQAEKDFTNTQAGISDDTPLREASEEFNSAVVGLELAWMQLFVDSGCATDEQIKQGQAAATEYTKALQKDLKDAGYYKDNVDGIYGPNTVAAVKAVQKGAGLEETGTVDRATALALQAELVKKGVADAKDELLTTSSIQRTLKVLGFYDGDIDGVWTDELTQAVKDFQIALGVEPTGVIDAETIAAVQEALEAFINPSPSPTPSPSQH